MTLAPGTKLGPYEILARIGAGGMGEVWKARDTRLGRIVAIKKVKEQHSERFKQEARSIAALNNSYICQLHDIGEDYLVLEYVEGKPLSSPLPEREAVRLAIQIATALEAAHRKGVIHRDLKPGNIMVTEEGSVKLLDFGLAKLYEQDAGISTSPTADYPPTEAGTVLGTAAYMSPEQAQGQPVDVLSDIFSFGLVLYEMLSGKRAFAGESSAVVLAALLRDEPAPFHTSPALEKIVRRCLAKQPSGRYQTIAEVKTALEQVMIEKAAQSSAEMQLSIAVLPFVNMSGDKEQEYFSDGLAEEIINALTHIPGLKVIARTSAFAFKNKQKDVRKIAEILGVANILEGSVRKAGNRIRVTAQLITAADGSHLWSERYDRDMTDVFAIQDEISQAIAQKLRVELVAGRPLVKRHTENVEAYNLFMKGRHYIHRYTQQSLAKGREFCEQAIALDPNYSLAWFGIARFYQVMGLLGFMQPKTAYGQASQAALKALELDEMVPETHCMTAILRAYEYDWQGADREFRRALELGPKSADVWHSYSYFYLVPMLHLDEAVAASQKALELDPLSAAMQYHLGHRYYLKRQWERAIKQFNNALDIDPHYLFSYYSLGVTYWMMGKHDEAVRTFEAATQIETQDSFLLAYLAAAYNGAGRTDKAQKVMEELQGRAKFTYVADSAFAIVYVGFGEIDKALDRLEKSVEEHDMRILHLGVSPFHDPLRSHPRYHALLRKMNLPE